MIKAYLAAIPSLYEGEDIEVRYSIFKDEVLARQESGFLEYVKPALVGQASVLTLLPKLEKYKEEEIRIFINDASLYEILRGTNPTKNGDVIKMSDKIKKQLKKFKNLTFENITKNQAVLSEWKEYTK
ncbi:MAG: hypothetical protein RR768_06560 [Clostridium sp.]